MSRPEDENQRPNKISRLESYNAMFRPTLEDRCFTQTTDQNEPRDGFNGLCLNVQPGEQGLGFSNSESNSYPTRNGYTAMSSEGSTHDLPSQSPPSSECLDSAAVRSRASVSKARRKPCCKKPKKQSPQSSPEALNDATSDTNTSSSALNNDFERAAVHQSPPTGSTSFFGDVKGHEATPFQAQFTFQAPQVPYTTLYNMPPTYATAANPLTLEQQAFMLQNSQLHSQVVPQYAPSGLIGSAAPSAEGSDAFSLMHDCSCGPNCQCMFCVVHPYNAPTRDRVQMLADLLPFDDAGHSSQSRPQSSYGSISHSPEGDGAGTATHGPRIQEHPPVLSPMPQIPLTQLDPDSDNFQAMPFASLDQAQHSTAPSSGYLTMAYEYSPGPLESCTSGNCRCGDNCACVGCLTHTGHNGQPLQIN